MPKTVLEFDLLEFAPTKVHRDRYKKLAKSAHTSARAAIKLKCIDCSGWEYAEAKNCTVEGCPLYVFNRKIFLKEIKEELRAAKPDCKTEGCTNKVFVAATGLCVKCMKEKNNNE